MLCVFSQLEQALTLQLLVQIPKREREGDQGEGGTVEGEREEERRGVVERNREQNRG